MVFSRDLFHQPEKLSALFQSDKAIADVHDLYQISVKKPYNDLLYFNRWKVVWTICTFPFISIVICITNTLAILLSFCPRFSRPLQVLTYYLEKDLYYLFVKWSFGPRILVPTQNRHQLGSYSIYLQSPIKEKEISPELYKNLWKTSFYHPDGLCGGGTLWFNFLFLQNYSPSCDPKKLALAVSRQFTSGMPALAAILQTFKTDTRKQLLKMDTSLLDIENLRKKVSNTRTTLNRLVNQEFMRKTIVSKIKNMPNGCYYSILNTGPFDNHAVSLLKFDNFLAIWDPNYGLIELLTSRDIEHFFDKYQIKPNIPVRIFETSLPKEQQLISSA